MLSNQIRSFFNSSDHINPKLAELCRKLDDAERKVEWLERVLNIPPHNIA